MSIREQALPSVITNQTVDLLQKRLKQFDLTKPDRLSVSNAELQKLLRWTRTVSTLWQDLRLHGLLGQLQPYEARVKASACLTELVTQAEAVLTAGTESPNFAILKPIIEKMAVCIPRETGVTIVVSEWNHKQALVNAESALPNLAVRVWPAGPQVLPCLQTLLSRFQQSIEFSEPVEGEVAQWGKLHTVWQNVT